MKNYYKILTSYTRYLVRLLAIHTGKLNKSFKRSKLTSLPVLETLISKVSNKPIEGNLLFECSQYLKENWVDPDYDPHCHRYAIGYEAYAFCEPEYTLEYQMHYRGDKIFRLYFDIHDDLLSIFDLLIQAPDEWRFDHFGICEGYPTIFYPLSSFVDEDYDPLDEELLTDEQKYARMLAGKLVRALRASDRISETIRTLFGIDMSLIVKWVKNTGTVKYFIDWSVLTEILFCIIGTILPLEDRFSGSEKVKSFIRGKIEDICLLLPFVFKCEEEDR